MTPRPTAPGLQRAIVSLAAAVSFLAHPVGPAPRGVAPGDLDVRFGRSGVVTTDLGGNDWCFAVAVQADHKLLCAGDTRNDNGLRDFALVRYKAAGVIDRSFGSRGTVTTDFGGDDWQRAVAIQADGRIVGGGQADVGDRDFGLARHWPDGSSDATFGSGGTVTTDFGAHDWVNALAIQADGKILAAGVTTQGEATSDVAVARYLQDGSMDQAFGSGGLAILDLGGGDVARSVAIQSDWKILVGGYTGSRVELSD